MHYFACKLEVGFGALGFDVVVQDGLAVARCFRKAHVAGDDGLEHVLGEAAFGFGFDLTGGYAVSLVVFAVFLAASAALVVWCYKRSERPAKYCQAGFGSFLEEP
jgi:hypothetical protein